MLPSSFSEKEAQAIISCLEMASHAACHHPACKISERDNGEWLITCCGLGCPVHFCMILREKPVGRIDNHYMFSNFVAALWAPDAVLTFGPNGLQVSTGSGSGSIVLGDVHL